MRCVGCRRRVCERSRRDRDATGACPSWGGGVLPPRAVAAAAGAASCDSDRHRQTRGSLAKRCEIFCLVATSTAWKPFGGNIRRARARTTAAAAVAAGDLQAQHQAKRRQRRFRYVLRPSQALEIAGAEVLRASDTGVYAFGLAELEPLAPGPPYSAASVNASKGGMGGDLETSGASRIAPVQFRGDQTRTSPRAGWTSGCGDAVVARRITSPPDVYKAGRGPIS